MTDQHVDAAAPNVAEAVLEEPWAAWHLRVGASLVDALLQLPFLVVIFMCQSIVQDPGTTAATQLVVALFSLPVALASMIFSFWNNVVRQGRCGASLGKQCFGLLVLSLNDARPIGALSSFVRNLAHLLDTLSLGVGYLWPLVDKRKQTFADKVANTGVLRLPDVRF
jgi:uncharacterized RDD family membrane protein YckC